jgi:4-diphosphocytidyl-2-C-methyl-D-erythritol kinase
MATLKAYSKVNLILKVFPKQGSLPKHKIQSLMVLDKTIYDQITIIPSDRTTITYYLNNSIIKMRDCTVAKTISYLQKIYKTKLNYQISIYKKIPLMSGLGGSATDAASIIVYLLKLND